SALRPDLTAHRGDETLRDGQAEAASLLAVALGVPELEELVEHAIELVGRNARPRVAYASLDAAVGETAGRCPHVSGRGELDGVVEQVAEHPPELHAVRPNPDRGVDDVADEADSLRLRDRPQVGALI